MKTSTDRILTTHVGSLPRSQAVTDVVFGREQGAFEDQAAADQVIADAVDEIVRRQAKVGIDVFPITNYYDVTSCNLHR